ncbi:MAG: pilus assembly protein TadG-related protein [Ilumatobacteraceae bacterium]
MTARRSHDDRGSITLWVLGVTLVVMFVGWFSVTLWTGSDQRRQLAAAADQAAQAGATALDTATFRTSGVRQLDPTEARQRAIASLAEQHIDRLLTDYRVDASTTQVTVTLDGEVDIGLLRIFDRGDGSVAVHVSATGYPQGATP